MARRKRRRKRKISTVISLVLAAVILLGSLSFGELETKAAAKTTEAAERSESDETVSGGRFQHPGLLHSQEDLNKAWENVQNNVSPNKETWDALWGDSMSNPNWWPRPLETVTRGGTRDSINQLRIDVRRAYQNALIWKLSGDEAHGETACRTINAWSATMKYLGGNADRFLASGLQGYELANIGELMRDHPDFDTEGLQNLLLNVFYPMNQDFLIRHNDAHIGNYWANWELANIASMISIGVYCDREDIYEQALDFFKNGKGNGSFYHTMPYVLEQDGEELVQWQESVRDQGHTTLGLVLAGVICETAWNQGDDLYGLSDNRFMKAVEYSVKYNSLWEEVPSTYYFRAYGNMYNSAGGYNKPQYEGLAGVNPYQRGSWRPIYYQMYNHYVNRKGQEMSNVKRMIENTEGTYIEGAAGNSLDELGWYSLTYANTGDREEDIPIQGELTDGVYRICSASSGKSLVVNEQGNLASAAKGSRKDEWWMIKSNGDGEYTITNMVTGKAIQINGEGVGERVGNTYSNYYLEGVDVGTGDADGSRKQRFAFLKDNDGVFRIVPSYTYFVLALEGNSTDDNARIVQWWNDALGAYENYSNAGQRWTFEKATEVGMEFTFDDESAGFSTTYTEAEGNHTLENHGTGKAVSFNGTNQFLTVNAKTEKSVLAGETAFTVSFEAKPEAGNNGWLFYAAPDGTQENGKETYLGVKEEGGTVTACSYKAGETSASVSYAVNKNDWYQISVTFNGAEIILYINGQEKARQSGSYAIADILTDDAILQLGKANIGNGAYYKGQIDNFKVTGHVMSLGEIIQSAGDYAYEEIKTPEVLADFTFDDAEQGFTGGEAVAKGAYSLQDHGDGKALYLNGYKDYLKVTGKDGGSVLPGGLVKEMTISVQVKRDGGDYGWLFYAAPDDTSPIFEWEKYLGVIDGNGKITAQRYYNQGQRLTDAESNAQADRWHYLTAVYTENEIILYENGEERARVSNDTPLSQILGSDSIWYIGKANWIKGNGEKGEHFRGWIDNYKVISRAWTPEEIKTEALKYVDKTALQAAVDHQTSENADEYAEGRWETYQNALKHAQEILADETVLQSAVDSATDALENVQAWMRLDEALYASIPVEKEPDYTAKTWKPYKEALETAKQILADGTALREEVKTAAEALRSTQSQLIGKNDTIAEAIQRINAIGEVTLTPDCSRKAILARQTCDLLDEEELKAVTNVQKLTEAEEAMADYLVEFTFNDVETGFIGGQAVAEGQGDYVIKNGALYLDGTSSNWLNVTKANGDSLLRGREELTISFAAKPETGISNWLFMAAPDNNVLNYNYEKYLGLVEYQGTITAERYKNNGARPTMPSVPSVDTSDWIYVTMVQTETESILYINGEEKARQESDVKLTDILGENSILMIGKANWGSGEYYRGFLDNVKIMGTAMTAEEIKAEAKEHLDNIVEPEKVEEAMTKIAEIGSVEATVAVRKKIANARAMYDTLTVAEKKLVTNAQTLFDAEKLYKELSEAAKAVLVDFNFDDLEQGFRSENSVANASQTPVIVEDEERGNVLSMDGTGSVWLNVTKRDGTALLTGVEELTISYYSKAERSDTNWAFYAAPNKNAQKYGSEYYIGILENGGKVTAERYLSGRQSCPQASYEAGWNHIAVVYSADDTKLYINGILAGATSNDGALKEILGESSILQIGKANWGNGEYYKGRLDDYIVYNYVLTEEEIRSMNGLADNTPLLALIAEAKKIQQGYYTDASYANLQTAIAEAENAAVKTEEDVQEAMAALQAVIDALTVTELHEYDPDKWSADETEHWHTCENCALEFDRAAHIKDEGTVTKEPTETTAGERTYKCSVCGYVMETVEIPALGSSHSHVFGDDWESDETNHWYVCECGEKKDIAAHTEDDGTVTVEPTETTEGERTYKCSVCGYVIRTEKIPALGSSHSHLFGTDWKSDETNHWHACECGEKKDIAVHTRDDGTVTVEPTETTEGKRTYKCSVCGYVMEEEKIPALGVEMNPPGNQETDTKDKDAAVAVDRLIQAIGNVTVSAECSAKIEAARKAYNALTESQKKHVVNLGVLEAAEKSYQEQKAKQDAEMEGTQSVEEAQNAILKANTDKGDVPGSTFSKMKLKGTGANKSVKLSWSKLSGAEGYMLYGAACGKKLQYIGDIPASKKSYTIKKLTKGKYYRYMLAAYKTVNGEKRVIASTATVHVCTNGGKYGNPTGITFAKKSITVKKGKTYTLNPKYKQKRSVKVHVAKFRFESSNTKIATVTKKGKVKGIKKGSCTIYMYTQNGLFKTVKIKVK